MAREESSVTSSLQQLMVEEDQRRAEQVALAHRRKLEQDRELLEQRRRNAEQAERETRETALQASVERAERERLDRERVADLERVRSDLELRAKTAVMQLEQQHELERLALQRDRRLARVEGHRMVLSALLATLLVGALLLYGLLLLPESQRRDQTVAQLSRANAEQRSTGERERNQFELRIAGLRTELDQVKAQFDEARQSLAVCAARRQPVVPSRQRSAAPAEQPCVSDNDPLCGNLNRRPSR
jgi:hypothetical protein